MLTRIDEQAILESLRQVPTERWGEVLRFLKSLNDAETAIRTGDDLSRSELVGQWANRDDLGSSPDFARLLRRNAESRQGAGNVAGH